MKQVAKPHKSTIIICLSLAAFMLTILSSIQSHAEPTLQLVAKSDAQWTGVAVSQKGRIFVNYPRWTPDVPISVAELVKGKPVPFPNAPINKWAKGMNPKTQFVCVQSVYIDANNFLWVLDPANPLFKGVVEGGVKLVKIDLNTNAILHTYYFGTEVAPKKSYLNDVRIDTVHNYAYITDSGRGALIAVDLRTGNAQRWLSGHLTVKAEKITLTIAGKPWIKNGKPRKVHSDGIAYDPVHDMIYYQALTGRTMYKLPASKLRNFAVPEEVVEESIQTVGETGAADGLIYHDGYIYISSLEHDAIKRTTPDGKVETVITSPKISWPDSFSIGPDNMLYFTTTRIYEEPDFTQPFGLYRIKLPANSN